MKHRPTVWLSSSLHPTLCIKKKFLFANFYSYLKKNHREGEESLIFGADFKKSALSDRLKIFSSRVCSKKINKHNSWVYLMKQKPLSFASSGATRGGEANRVSPPSLKKYRPLSPPSHLTPAWSWVWTIFYQIYSMKKKYQIFLWRFAHHF